jgi:hypothetical protein
MKAPTFVNEDDLKYGNRDITLGSLVFRCSKDNEAGMMDHYLSTSTKTKT